MSTVPLGTIVGHPATRKPSTLCRTVALAKISQKRSEVEHSLKKPEATILKRAARTYTTVSYTHLRAHET